MKHPLSPVGTFAALATICIQLSGAEGKLDTNRIDQITGLKGKLNAKEGVYKVSLPRTDVKVVVDGFSLPPFMGLTSWAAFTSGNDKESMVMGDLVLMQDEVNSVMSAALDNGLDVTALHNHFFYDQPKVYFMHIGGEGQTEALAEGVKAALAKVTEIRAKNTVPSTSFSGTPIESGTISASALDEVFGQKGESKDGMYKVVIGRSAKMPCGCEVGKEMGLNTWAAFGGNDDMAIVDGDFAVKETELQGVLKSLRKSEINIVAIHHHMAEESPRYLFLHYWGKGKPVALAKAIRQALAIAEKP